MTKPPALEQRPSDTTFGVSGGPCCAHRHIVYEQVSHDGGLKSDSWRCRDCRTFFWPSPGAFPSPPSPTAAEQPARGDGVRERRVFEGVALNLLQNVAGYFYNVPLGQWDKRYRITVEILEDDHG